MSSSFASIMVVEYAKATQNVCTSLAVAIFLIILFMMTPINSFLLSSIFGKIIILILLGYIIYYNIQQTNKFSKEFNISLTSGNWNAIKSNISCSYIFTLFVVILFLSVVRKIIL